MPFEDNKDFWQEFILLYQEHSCLWDVKSQDYRNKQKRNGAYETLLQRCKELFPKANKEFVIKKISSLRASFRRQLRRLNAAKKSGTGAEDVPGTTLWYFELLSFLMDQEESCPAVPSIMLDESDVDEHSQVSDTESFTQDSTQCLHNWLALSHATPSSSSHRKRTQNENTTWIKKKHQIVDASLKVLNAEGTSQQTVESQEITFGKNVGQQLEQVNNRQKIIAQKLISDILFHAKLGNLTDSSNITLNHQL